MEGSTITHSSFAVCFMTCDELKERVGDLLQTVRAREKEPLPPEELNRQVNLRLVLEELLIDLDGSIGEHYDFGLISLDDIVDYVHGLLREALY